MELISLGLINIFLSLLGLFPVSIPMGRNLLALKTGVNNKIFHLLSAILLFLFAFSLWPIMKYLPILTISILNASLGIMIIDYYTMGLYILKSPRYA